MRLFSPSHHICCLLLMSLTLTMAKNLQVDANLTSANGTTYPSLNEALNALITWNNLTEPNNTITLLDSCLTVPQYFLGITIGPAGTGGGSINIVYNGWNSAINTEDACNQLPTLILANNSYIDLEYLNLFSISGVNIVFNHAPNLNLMYEVETLNFSNICFNNTEPDNTLPSTDYNYFVVIESNTFIMANGVYLFDEYKALMISDANQIAIDSITFIIEGSPIDGTMAAFELFNNGRYHMNTEISNISVSCGDLENYGPPELFLISNASNLEIFSLEMSGCRFNYPISDQKSVISVTNVPNFAMNNITIDTVTFAANQIFCYISSVSSAILSNFNIMNYDTSYENTFSGFTQFIYITDEQPGSYYPTSVTLQGFSFLKPKVFYAKFFYISFINYANYENILVQDFVLNFTISFTNSYFIYLEIQSPNNDSLSANITYFTIENMTVIDAVLNISTLCYFSLANPTAITATEILRLNIKDSFFGDVNLSPGTVIETEGILTNIEDTQVSGGFYYQNSYFYLNQNILNTFLMKNTWFSLIFITEFSALVSTSADSSYIVYPEASFEDPLDEAVYAETKPLIIYNTSFTNLSVEYYCSIISSSSPETVIYQNTFSQIYNYNSSLLILGNLTGGLYNSPNVVPFVQAERSIFQDYSDFYEIYNNSRVTISLYDPEYNAFFLLLQENLFDSISTARTNYLIQITNFVTTYGTVVASNNQFVSLTSADDMADDMITSVFAHVESIRGNYIGNSLTQGNLTCFFFSIISSQNFPYNITVSSNTLTDSSNSRFFSLTVHECGLINFKNAYAADLEISSTFIDINCQSFQNDLILQNFTFTNIYQTLAQGNLLSSTNFISIVNAGPAFGFIILLQNCHFYNMTMINLKSSMTKFYTSSFIYITTLADGLSFDLNTFDTLLASPKGGVILISARTVTISNSTIRNIGFGSSSGGIAVLSEFTIIENSVFENNYGLDLNGAGLLELVHIDPSDEIRTSNQWLNIIIQNSTFSNNTMPYGSIMDVQDTSIQLTLNQVQILDNQVTALGGLINLVGLSFSTISVVDCYFQQIQGYLTTYPQLEVFTFVNTGSNVSIALSNATVLSRGQVYGVFISIESSAPVAVTVNEMLFFAEYIMQDNGPEESKFGFLQADNFEASIANFQAKNVSLDQTPIFTINCNTASKQFFTWSLTLLDSNFNGLTLNEALFLINYDGNLIAPLNDLQLRILNTSFNNISWSVSSVNSAAGGIIRSSTSLIGRTTPSPDFAIVLKGSTFSQLSGITASLLFNSVESMYDSVMMINNCTFSSFASIGAGTLINPTTTQLTSFNSQYPSSIARNASYSIKSSTFIDIQGTNGCLLYWHSNVKGLLVTLKDNNFTNFVCTQEGGIFYMSYNVNFNFTNMSLNDQLTEEFEVIVNSKNNVYQSINTDSGGILYAIGENRLFQFNFEQDAIENVQASQNGGVIQISTSANLITSSSTAANIRRLSSSMQSSVGNLAITGSNLTAITATDGAVIYEATINSTIEIILDSNIFEAIGATSRGGVLFISQPYLSIINNTFNEVSAKYSGNIVFALSGEVDLSDLSANNNTVIPNSTELFSYQPTNLKVRFMSLVNSSTLQLENEDVLPYSPTVTGLTSYSLSQYQIDLALIYEGTQGSQIAMDGSSTAEITLVFTTQRDNSSLKYSGSNCSNSICSIVTSNIILKGLAEDLVIVNATYTSNLYTITQQFDIRLRSCIPGEINVTSSLECTYCLVGTYSFTPNDTSCKECPNGAICFGGTNISISQGYYWSNASQTELLLVNCNDNGTRCLGGFENTCEETFSGPVCLQCNLEKGYISGGKVTECSVCYEKSKLIPLAIFLLLASIGYQIIMIIVTYKENKSIYEEYQVTKSMTDDLKPGQFMVIFSKFCQILSVLPGMDGGSVDSLLGVSNTVGNSNTQVMFSIQCLYSLVTQDKLKGLQFQILVYILSPLVKILFVMLIELIRNLCCRDKRGQGRRKSLIRIGSVAVVLILLEQPGIVGILCKYLNCSKLDPNVDEYYVKFYSDVQCYTNKYNLFAWVVVLPALIFWAFILPISIFGILYKNRMRLYESEAIRIVLGNLYNSHSKKTYYWGVVILFFQLTLFILNSLITASDIFKGVIFMMIIHLYYQVLKRIRPYNNLRLILAEKCCCIAYMSILTLVFLKESTDNDGFQVTCEVFICISIVIAGAYMASNMGILIATKFFAFIKRREDEKKQKAILVETLDFLETYHRQNKRSKGFESQYQRREAISVDLPQRLRDTENYERELTRLKRKKTSALKNSHVWNRVKSLFSGGSLLDLDGAPQLARSPLHEIKSTGEVIKEKDESMVKELVKRKRVGEVNMDDQVIAEEGEIRIETENRLNEPPNSIDIEMVPRSLLENLRAINPNKIESNVISPSELVSENKIEIQSSISTKSNLLKKN